MSYYTREDVIRLLKEPQALTELALFEFRKALDSDKDTFPQLGHKFCNMMPIVEIEDQSVSYQTGRE